MQDLAHNCSSDGPLPFQVESYCKEIQRLAGAVVAVGPLRNATAALVQVGKGGMACQEEVSFYRVRACSFEHTLLSMYFCMSRFKLFIV